MKKDPMQTLLTYRWLIFAALAPAYFLAFFHRLSLSVIAQDLARDLSASPAVLGFLGSSYFYCYALMQLPAGLLSDSVGPRKTVTLSLLLAALGSFLFAITPGISLACLARILIGLGVSMVFISTLKIISQWFQRREFALMTGVLNAVGGTGVLAATALLGFLTSWFGWRISFAVLAVFTLLMSSLVWILVRNRPAEKGFPAIEPFDPSQAASHPSENKIALWHGVRKVVTEKYFWPVALMFFLDCGIFYGFGALWAGPYLMDVYGLSKTSAGAVLSMIAWGMILGSPLIGFLSEHVITSRKQFALIITLLIFVLQMILYLFPANIPKPLLYLWFFLFAFVFSGVIVIGFTNAKELFPLEMAGTAVGLANIFPFFGGAVFMPFLGRILQTYPIIGAGGFPLEAYRTVLLVLLAASILAAIAAAFLRDTSRK